MAARNAYTSQSRFALLGEETLGDQEESEESEEEVVEEAKSSPPSTAVLPPAPAPTTKSAQKKAARQRKKASTDGDSPTPSTSESKLAPKAAPTLPAPAVEVVEKVKEEIKSADIPKVVDQAKEESVKVQESATKVAGKAVETVKETASAAAESIKPAVNGVSKLVSAGTEQLKAYPSKAYAAALESTSEIQKSLPSTADLKSSLPSAHKFAPALPATLPSAPSNGLLSNRKRKPTAELSSPNSKGVKFQDGLSPGEGEEGEMTIPGVDKYDDGSEGKGGKGLVQGTVGKAGVVEKKSRNAVERTVWTFIMIGGFIALLCMGHPYVIMLVMLCQTLVYKEVTALFALSDHGDYKQGKDAPGEKGDKWNKTLNWYFFVVTNYFLYGESIIYYFKHIVFVDAYFLPFAMNHRFISFMLYVVGFVGFVANLQKQYLQQQFALFCWVHMSLLVIVVSSHFIVNNILEGLIWFFIPASLVICNDIWAYICGKSFGRTPLIKLSPKKTVEGFVGAFFCTLLFGLVWGTYFMRFNYMICPAHDLGVSVLSKVTCKPNPVFLWREVQWSSFAAHTYKTVFGSAPPTLNYAPFQLHVLVLATFASLVAPFGGFFASGFKRAFNIKDFGDSIPGHGGMTDRMDCQFLMGMFSYVYYSSMIRSNHATVGTVLQTIVQSLSVEEQLEVLSDLIRYLDGQGVKLGAVPGLKGLIK